MEIKDKIDKLERDFNIQLLKIKQEITNSDKDKIDFSKWIGRDGEILAIKGKTLLKSFDDGDLYYSNFGKNNYNDKINYEVIDSFELKPGDVFIDDDFTDFKLSYFKIFVGVDNIGVMRYQYPISYDDLEYIDNYYWTLNIKVKRFLRD